MNFAAPEKRWFSRRSQWKFTPMTTSLISKTQPSAGVKTRGSVKTLPCQERFPSGVTEMVCGPVTAVPATLYEPMRTMSMLGAERMPTETVGSM